MWSIHGIVPADYKVFHCTRAGIWEGWQKFRAPPVTGQFKQSIPLRHFIMNVWFFLSVSKGSE